MTPPASLLNLAAAGDPAQLLPAREQMAFTLGFHIIWFAWLWWRRRDRLTVNRWFLWAAALCGLASIASLESGWVVTEVGRQPWVVVGHLLTRDAVATQGDLWPFFGSVLALYTAVGATALWVLRSMKRRWDEQGDDAVSVPYGPADDRGPGDRTDGALHG